MQFLILNDVPYHHLTSNREVKVHQSNYQLKETLINGEFGSMYIEQLEGMQYRICRFVGILENQVDLRLIYNRPFLFLRYFLQGRSQVGNNAVPVGNYRMAYKNNIQVNVSLSPGIHESVSINLCENYLQKISYPTAIASLLDNYREGRLSISYGPTCPITGNAYRCLHKLMDNLQAPQGVSIDTQIDELLMAYEAEIDPDILQKSEAGNSREIIMQIKSFIDNHLQEDLGISRLTAIFFLSAATIQRKFKKHAGASLYDYIRTKRMVKALGLLKQSDLPVHEIAELCGYQNSSSFDHAFVNYYGHPPAYYRPV